MTRLVLLLCLWLPLATGAADLAREARWAEAIAARPSDGELVRLQADAAEFLAVHRRGAEVPARGAVILLHERGAHPAREGALLELARSLPRHGWDTLAIQLPVASADAPPADWEDLVPEAGPRIGAAVAWLAAAGVRNQALVGRGLGARMALAYLAAANPPRELRAMALIGMPGAPAPDAPGGLTALGKLRLPVLDLYGERDRADVRAAAAQRRLAARDAGNAAYTQLELPGADPDYTGVAGPLADRVRAWLVRVAAGTAVPGAGRRP